MAEFGSEHFMSAGSKPSIFSILAQESLAFGLRDAFRHFSKILAENFPDKFIILHKNFEELYTLMEFVFNCIHFRIRGASFPEYFYDMRRFPDPRTLSVSCRKLVLWVLVMSIFPYLRMQCEKLFKIIREKEEDGSLTTDFNLQKQKMALFYKKIYPSFHFTWEFIILIYFMAYALNKSDYHSPLLHITSSKLQSSGPDDIISNSWENRLLTHHRKIYSILWLFLKSFTTTVTVGVSFGAFFLQFLDWWYTRDGRTRILPAAPVPPPPPKWPCDIASGICPICLKSRTNDTALSCSGFVFCYPCIFRYVEENRCCPVTGHPATLDELVKIYQLNE